MTIEPEAVFSAALSLPRNSRATLADLLWDSLEETDSEEVSEAWLREAERRMDAFDKGPTKSIPGEEVFRALRERKRT
jgi:putative addiction module component (TIGR02574 family)